jgi:hypothetical protein
VGDHHASGRGSGCNCVWFYTLNFFERLNLLYRDGVIDGQRWKAWESWISYSMATSAIFPNVWHDSCGLHHADFVAYIEAHYDDGICSPETAQGNLTIGPPATAPAQYLPVMWKRRDVASRRTG